MSEKLEVLSVEDIETYITSGKLQDSCHIALNRTLAYCRLLISLYRQTDTLAKELKANVNAARERAASTTGELVAMTKRADTAEAKLEAVPVDAIRRCWAQEYVSEDDWANDSATVWDWLDAMEAVVTAP